VRARGDPRSRACASSAGHHLLVLARGAREALVAAVSAVAGVVTVESEAREGDTWELRVSAGEDVRERVAAAVVAVGQLRELRPVVVGLAQIFARLTGGESPPRRALPAEDAR
jgi:hypothetical protein